MATPLKSTYAALHFLHKVHVSMAFKTSGRFAVANLTTGSLEQTQDTAVFPLAAEVMVLDGVRGPTFELSGASRSETLR